MYPREAFVANIQDELFDWLTLGEQKVAQLEMLMIAHALINRASMFRKRRRFWFIDNVASLMCLIRGRRTPLTLKRLRSSFTLLFLRWKLYCFGNIPPVSQIGLI